MDLKHKFAEQAAQRGTDFTAPPYRIRGKDLDENFNQVKPDTHIGNGEQKAYRVSEDPQRGWELIFPWWPPPRGGSYVLASVNGQMTWIPTEECPT